MPDTADDYADRIDHRMGFRKTESSGNQGHEYLVLTEPFVATFCEGYTQKQVVEVLAKYGFIRLGANGRSTVTERLPGMGPARVYCIKPNILQDTDEEPMGCTLPTPICESVNVA